MHKEYWNERKNIPVDNMKVPQGIDYCGHLYLPTIGNNRMTTRLQIPITLRKIGMWITYRAENSTVINEVYQGLTVSDGEWGKNENWVLVEDLFAKKILEDKSNIFWKNLNNILEKSLEEIFRKFQDEEQEEDSEEQEEDSEEQDEDSEEQEEDTEDELVTLVYKTTSVNEEVRLTTHGEYFDQIVIDDKEVTLETGYVTYTFSDIGEHEVQVKLKDDLTSLTGCFQYCTNLLRVSSNLFDNCTEVTDFGFTFYRCTTLESIPSGLFDKNTNNISFLATFDGCSSITSIPSGLFDKNTKATTFSQTFQSCTSLADVPDYLFDNNTYATSFANAFRECTSLASVPTRLFYYNTSVTSFAYTFCGCSSLELNVYIGSEKVTSANYFAYETVSATVHVKVSSTTMSTFSNATEANVYIKLFE